MHNVPLCSRVRRDPRTHVISALMPSYARARHNPSRSPNRSRNKNRSPLIAASSSRCRHALYTPSAINLFHLPHRKHVRRPHRRTNSHHFMPFCRCPPSPLEYSSGFFLLYIHLYTWRSLCRPTDTQLSCLCKRHLHLLRFLPYLRSLAFSCYY